MTNKEYEQRLESLEREIAALRQEAVEDGAKIPPHPRLKINNGDVAYYIENNGRTFQGAWFNSPWDLDRVAIGNVFLTAEAARYAAERLKVLAEMREWAGIWDDPWVMIYDGWSPKAISIHAPDITFGEMRFATKEDAENCIKAIGKDRLKKYYFMIPEEKHDDDCRA